MAKKVSEVYQYAYRLHQQGDLEKASEVYEKIIVKCPASRSAAMAKKRLQEIEELQTVRQKRARAAEKAEKKREKQQQRDAQQEGQPTASEAKLEFFSFLSGTVLCAGIILPLLIHLIISHMAIFAGTTTTRVFFLSSTGTSVIALALAIAGFVKSRAAGSKWQKRSLIWMIASGAASLIFLALTLWVQFN